MSDYARPATADEVRAACMDRSATEASRYLANQNKRVTVTACQVVIARLIASGERMRMPSCGFVSDGDVLEISRGHAAKGCNALLRRMLETGQHSLATLDDVLAAWASIGVYRHD